MPPPLRGLATVAHLPRLPILAFVFLVLHVHVPTSHGAPLPPTYNRSMCLDEFECGGVDIHYPFSLASAIRATPDNTANYLCGYTDLRIFCRDDGYGEAAIIELGQDEYRIKGIFYDNNTIILADTVAFRSDAFSCPVIDHNVTFDTEWLRYTGSYESLTFCSGCYLNDDMPPELRRYQIGCYRFPGAAFMFSPDEGDLPREVKLSEHCDEISIAPVFNESVARMSNLSVLRRDYGDLIREGFELAWSRTAADNCSRCEGSGGRCAYSQNKLFMGCLCSNGKVGTPECRRKKVSTAKIVGIAAGGFTFLLVAGIIAFFVVRKRKQNKGVNSSSKLLKYSGSGGTPYSQGRDTESGSVQDPPTHLFSYEELEEATDGFNDNRELGDGGFGTVYKGYLKDGRVVAVKRLYNNSYRRVEQFVNEAAILSRLRHPNLVMFYGCTSSSSRELLLVYEFVANGTVADHLHGHRAPERALSWPLRLNIAVESAAALTYLHAIDQPIVHRDVKTTNILLDADFHVKVADFGLSRLFPLDATHVSTAPQGTPGYVDPEYHQCYQLTDKSDVYSFGVVLVELISSKPAVDITRHRNEINLAGMAVNKIQKCQLDELVDLELGYESDPATKKMMTMVAELAFRCLQQNGEMRPPIREVLEVLKAIQGECLVNDKGGDKDKGLAGTGSFSPNTVHAPWDSRATTPNTSRD